MLDYERPEWPLMGAYSARRYLEKIMILPDMLKKCDVSQLLDCADRLDPNNGWRESVAEDNSITCNALYWSMLAAYDDADTHAWINK